MSFAVAVCYLLALMLAAGLILVGLNQFMAFDELRWHHRSPVEECASLNPLVLPEYSAHALLCVAFLCAAEWLTLALNAPLLAYHAWRYRRRPRGMSHPGLYDPTAIMRGDSLAFGRREASYKVAFYCSSFFYYLGRMLCCLIWS